MKSNQDTIVDTSADASASEHSSPRLGVLKTYKLYIGGKFPRTESGRHYKLEGGGETLANLCLASRKDFRNAVVAARAAQAGWAGASAFLRSQILYRIAEMLEGRATQFATELVQMGSDPEAARAEVARSIDTLVHYAGWADKYGPVFSSVNPVASSHFNFSIPNPTGVVGVVAPEDSGLSRVDRRGGPGHRRGQHRGGAGVAQQGAERRDAGGGAAHLGSARRGGESVDRRARRTA